MDISKFSTADLQAMQAGDLSKVSTEGLNVLHTQAHAERAASDYAQMAQEMNPTNDMGTGQRVLAGIGQGMSSVGRGVGQLAGKLLPDSWDDKIGLPTQASIDESKRQDAPLLATGAGKAGSAVGNIAAALPVALIPGVNGYAAAAGVGAASGALQPVASDEGDFSRLKNTAVGAAAGPLGVGAARVVGGVVNAGKAIVQPMYQAGRDQIAGKVLARFADNPNALAQATTSKSITGATPTLAEQTGDRGIAQLQDALGSLDPQIGTAIGNRLAQNNAARVGKLNELAGTDGGRDFAVANRAGTAGPMYDEAFGVIPDASLLTAEQARSMGTLMKSPAIQSALKDAQTIAKNNGTNVGASNATGSIEGMHNMKLSMDDAISAATTAGNTNKAASIKAAQGKLVDLMESMSPEYASARGTYAQMSKPINSMDVAAQVARRGLSNGTNLTTGSQTINPNALLGSMRDEGSLIQQATGRQGLGNKLSDVMAPEDENMLRTIASEADRTAGVAAAGNGPGSATAKRMASQNVINSLLGPLGSPGGASEGWMRSLGEALFKSPVGGAVNLLHAGYEPDIQRTLAQAILDPSTASRVLAAAQKASVRLPPGIAQKLALTASGQTARQGAENATSP